MSNITIEEVKDILKCSIDETTNMNEAIERTLQHIYLKGWNDAENLLSVPLQWIPVTKRLPKKSGKYLVSVIDEDDEMYKQTGVAWYLHPNDCNVKEGEWRELMIDKKVLAWMPLPKPYKGESEE